MDGTMRRWVANAAAAGLILAIAPGCATGGAAAPEGGTADAPAQDAPSHADSSRPADAMPEHDASPVQDAAPPRDSRADTADAAPMDASPDTTLDAPSDAPVPAEATLDAEAGPAEASCPADAVCGAGAKGTACASGASCLSGFCAGAVCCDSPCDGTCVACTASLTGASDGTCSAILAGTQAPAGQCPATPCGYDGKCSGGACEEVTAGTPCSAGTCSGGAMATGTCNAGLCDPGGAPTSCGAYNCNDAGTACLLGCAGDSDCSSDAGYCADSGAEAGVCSAKQADGAPCTSADQCQGGACTGSPGICAENGCNDGQQDGQETGVDCGGPVCSICPTVLLVAAGSAGSIGAELHPTAASGGTWSATTTLDAPSVSALSVSLAGSGETARGLSVARYTEAGATLDQSLVYALWSPGATTLDGTWTQAFTAVASGVTTRDAPAIAATGTTQVVGFQGTDYKYCLASFAGGAWTQTSEPVEPSGGAQAAGPTPPGIAAAASTATLAYFANATNVATAQSLTTSWQAPVTLDGTTADESYVTSPALVAMSGGAAELLVAFARQSDGEVLYAARTSGAWSAAAPVPGASTPTATSSGGLAERLGLAALPGGGAILAWRDRATSGVYTSVYSGGAWSTATSMASPNVTVDAAPSVARGVAGATAEMAFVDASGVAYHTRLVGGAWTVPVAVGGTGLSHVTISTAP